MKRLSIGNGSSYSDTFTYDEAPAHVLTIMLDLRNLRKINEVLPSVKGKDLVALSTSSYDVWSSVKSLAKRLPEFFLEMKKSSDLLQTALQKINKDIHFEYIHNGVSIHIPEMKGTLDLRTDTLTLATLEKTITLPLTAKESQILESVVEHINRKPEVIEESQRTYAAIRSLFTAENVNIKELAVAQLRELEHRKPLKKMSDKEIHQRLVEVFQSVQGRTVEQIAHINKVHPQVKALAEHAEQLSFVIGGNTTYRESVLALVKKNEADLSHMRTLTKSLWNEISQPILGPHRANRSLPPPSNP